MTWIICTYCGSVVAPDGPDGLMPHLIAFHEESPEAQLIMRMLARLPLPELAR
jgi:hypothetical protein